MSGVRRLSLIGLVLGALAAPETSLGSTTRFEAESTGAVKDQNDAVGYDSINGVVGRAADPGASNGEILFTAGNARNFKIGFVGTGIDLVTRLADDGGDFDWILNEGQLTGSGSTLSATTVNQGVVPIVAGLPKTLHTLEVRRKSSGVLRVDAFDVHNAGSQTRYEQDDPAISYTGNWLLNDVSSDAPAEASGGTIGYTLESGNTATLYFTGTAVSLLAVARADASPFDFSIDDGAVTGTINVGPANQLSFGFWNRWPILLANNLSPGAHKLELTSRITFGAANFDAIDVWAIPEPTTATLLGASVAVFGAIRRRRD